MATTTNYGWATPDDTDLVKDGAAAIRTLGSSVDTTTKALNPSTTLGDIEYRSATANTNTRLAIGTTGQILTVTGGVPVWAAPAGGGKVLQVINATHNTEVDSASNSYVDTGLTASITPSAATSKILVLVSQGYLIKHNASAELIGQMNIVRGATQLQQSTFGVRATISGELNNASVWSYSYLDDPNTTSATTYKTQVKNTAGLGTMRSTNNGLASITLMEIGA
jgi:hypothetical protein